MSKQNRGVQLRWRKKNLNFPDYDFWFVIACSAYDKTRKTVIWTFQKSSKLYFVEHPIGDLDKNDEFFTK